MFKLVAMDLDDTLLDEEKKVPKDTADILKRLHDNGIHIVISSGRMTPTQMSIAKAFTQDISYISYNGSVVVFEDGQRAEFDIPVDKIREVVRYCNEEHLYVVIYHNESIYAQTYEEGLRYDIDTINARSVEIMDFLEGEIFPTPKIVILAHPDKVPTIVKDVEKRFPDLFITRSNSAVIEFMPKGVSKESGLKLVCEHLGIDREEVIAFGDNYNDMSMVEWAGMGVAVANSVDDLKAVADKVSVKERSEGVAEVLREVFSDILR